MLEIELRTQLHCTRITRACYLPEVSTDMVNWTAAGPQQNGTATFRLTFSESVDPPPGTGRRYFRAREL